MGNGEAKNLCVRPMNMSQGGRNEGVRGSAGQRRIKGRKKWGNCNSIINKIYLERQNKNTRFNMQEAKETHDARY